MIGEDLLSCPADHPAFPPRSHEHSVDGFFALRSSQLFCPLRAVKNGCFVHQVLQIRTCKSRCAPGQDRQIHVRCQRLVAGVNLENSFPAGNIGVVDDNLSVKPARPQKCRPNTSGLLVAARIMIPTIGVKAVHFHQELVQCLFPLVVSAAETCSR